MQTPLANAAGYFSPVETGTLAGAAGQYQTPGTGAIGVARGAFSLAGDTGALGAAPGFYTVSPALQLEDAVQYFAVVGSAINGAAGYFNPERVETGTFYYVESAYVDPAYVE